MKLSEIIGIGPYNEALGDDWISIVKSQATDMIRAGVFPTCSDWAGWTLLERKIWRDAKEEYDASDKEAIEAVEGDITEQLKNMTDMIHDMNKTTGAIKSLGGKL